MVNSVTINASNYQQSVAITSKSSSSLTLDIRALSDGWSDTSPAPLSKPTLTFYYGNGSIVTAQIDTGIIPVFFVNLQAWGQCTWYAGIIMRNRNGQSPVTSYSDTVKLSGDPNSSGFPKNGSVLAVIVNRVGKHMAYLENITAATPVKNKDGSTSTTYTLTGSQYNADCKSSKSPFTTTMVVKKSSNGKTYKITTAPKVANLNVTNVKQ